MYEEDQDLIMMLVKRIEWYAVELDREQLGREKWRQMYIELGGKFAAEEVRKMQDDDAS